MENELKRVECWTGFQARNYDEKRDDDGTFYYADEVDEVLASLRARLEAAERKAREWQSAAHAAGDRATAAERELEYLKEVSAKRDADVLTALDYKGTDSTPLHAAHVRLSELLEAKRQNDAANGLLRRAHSSLSGSSSPTARKVYEAIDAHLAASPSPAANSGVADQSLASPEGDGARRECAVVPDCDGEVHDPRVDEDTGQRICRVCDLNMDEASCLEGGDAHRLGPDDCNGDVYCEDCGELCVPNPGRPSNAEGSGA